MSGKGSKQRPGTGYADNWDRIFGKKQEPSELNWHYGPTAEDPDHGKRWHYGCGGEVLFIDGADICGKCGQQHQEPEAQTVAQDAALDAAFRKYGTYPGKVWYKQADGSLLLADGGAPLADAGKNYVAIVHSVRDWEAELKGQPQGEDPVGLIQGEIGTVDCGFRIVPNEGTEFTMPDKTCQTCRHWNIKHGKVRQCDNYEVSDMLDADSWRAFEPPADFGCNRWEGKA